MKRGIAVLLSLSVLVTSAYFTASKWAIRHETISFYDPDRNNRLVAVDIAVRRDKEIQANAGWITLPVAILNHGNTVKHTEYSFLSNVFAFPRLPGTRPAARSADRSADGDESRRALRRPPAANSARRRQHSFCHRRNEEFSPTPTIPS